MPKQQSVSRVTSIAVPVKVITGCSARPRMCCGSAVVEEADPVAARGVDDDLPGLPRAGGGEPGHQRGQVVVGDRQQQQLGLGDDLLDGAHGDAGQQGGGAGPGGLADAGDRDDAVPGPLQRGPQHGADPAGADDADPQSGRPVLGSAHSRNAISPTGPVPCCPWSRPRGRTAWQHALYGPDGFYRQPVGPAGHFATSTQGGPQMGAGPRRRPGHADG